VNGLIQRETCKGRSKWRVGGEIQMVLFLRVVEQTWHQTKSEICKKILNYAGFGDEFAVNLMFSSSKGSYWSFRAITLVAIPKLMVTGLVFPLASVSFRQEVTTIFVSLAQRHPSNVQTGIAADMQYHANAWSVISCYKYKIAEHDGFKCPARLGLFWA